MKGQHQRWIWGRNESIYFQKTEPTSKLSSPTSMKVWKHCCIKRETRKKAEKNEKNLELVSGFIFKIISSRPFWLTAKAKGITGFLLVLLLMLIDKSKGIIGFWLLLSCMKIPTPFTILAAKRRGKNFQKMVVALLEVSKGKLRNKISTEKETRRKKKP